MGTALELAGPAAVLLLLIVGGIELVVHKRRKHNRTPLATTYTNEFTAIFYGTKRTELQHRDTMSMLREEDAQGAPPGHDIDLDRGVVVLRPEPDEPTTDGPEPRS